jgi:hypothetical protein
MSLSLNLIEIKGHSLKVAATIPLPADDLSGQSSYSDTAETGDKPKQLTVNLQVKFDDVANLTQIITLAEAKTDTGSRVIYNVLNNTAQAMSIRQARFQGDVSVREDESLKLWSVMFKLSEVSSVPEKKSARIEEQAVTDQAPTGETVAAVDTSAPAGNELSSFEGVLAWLDGVFADDESGTV